MAKTLTTDRINNDRKGIMIMKKFSRLISILTLFVICFSFAGKAFALMPVDISTGEITLDSASYTYNASEIEPDVTLKVNDTVLVLDTDYTLSYLENTNAGTATVTAQGMGEYSGELSKDFTISAHSLNSSDISYKSTSKANPNKAPAYEVYYGNTLLKEGVDYTFSASGYDKTGVQSATLRFTGIGNFKDTKTLKANVFPNKVTSFSTTNCKTNSLDLHWASQSNDAVTGYKVYTCDKDGKNAKLYATVKTNSCTVKDRSPGSLYYFMVKAYKSSGSTTLTGDASAVYLTTSKPVTVSMKNVVKTKDKSKLVISWSKATGNGYVVQYSADKNFKKGVQTIDVPNGSTTSKTVAIPKNNADYYARVRAYRRYNNNITTIYGDFSSKISSSYSKVYASYSTKYVNNKNRTNNLKLACKAINGTIVYPGETFSFNKTVGKRTTAKGYKEAYVFTGPKSHTMGVGGGVCQVASTMFNAALLANFKIVERHQHSQRVTYCPLGRDAAIYWGSEDFKFKNNTSYPIKIVMSCSGGTIKCTYKVCYDVSPKKVKLSVSRKGKNFTLKRKVGGKTNYTAYSKY